MKRIFVISLFLSLGLCLTTLEAQIDQVIDRQGKYVIARYAIASGGILGATGSNYRHAATAGETFVGGMHGANNFLFSGFWLPAGYGQTAVDQKQAEAARGLPTSFKLHQNFPNPFNPQSTIQYDLPGTYKVTVEVFNIAGQRIRVLLNSQIQGPGFVQVDWDGRDDRGKMMGSGIYLYRVMAFATKAGNNDTNILFQQTKKMLLVK